MTRHTAGITLSVGHPAGDEDSLTPIGEVAFGEGGKLTVLGAIPAFAPALEDIVNAVNAQAELRIKVPPPPDAEPMSVFRRSVPRDDPDLLGAMRDYLEQKYNLIVSEKGGGSANG